MPFPIIFAVVVTTVSAGFAVLRSMTRKKDTRCPYCKEHGFQASNLCEDCRSKTKV